MFIVMVQQETIVYNTAKNKYEVSAIRKQKYSFKNQEEMVKKMSVKLGYEYKSNIYKNQSGWVKVTTVSSNHDNHPDHIIVCTGLIYSVEES